MLNQQIAKVEAGQNLSQEEMATAIDLVMQGRCEEGQIRSLLLALATKGEAVEEIAGAAAAMRAHMTLLESTRQDLVDTCGTGGDGSGTFNISTAAALVAADVVAAATLSQVCSLGLLLRTPHTPHSICWCPLPPPPLCRDYSLSMLSLLPTAPHAACVWVQSLAAIR